MHQILSQVKILLLMEDGLLNKIKVVYILQARMGSSRFPGKVLLPIPLLEGKPIIQRIIDELAFSSFMGEVILATSITQENNVLYDYCQSNSINCYRGAEDNVLSRFISVVKSEKYDVVVRLTGDNPILDVKLLDKAITHHWLNKNDYTYTIELPIGMNFEIISTAALLSLEHLDTTSEEREHVTLYFKNNKGYKKQEFKQFNHMVFKDIRLTIDYPSDYLVVSLVLSLSNVFSMKGIELIEKVLHLYPWIFEVNSKNIQKVL